MRPILVAAFLLLIGSAAAAKPPFDFATAPGRLSKDVVPVDYRIAIVPDAASKTLSGTETIALEVRKPVSTIAFNSLNERLTDVKLDGAAVAAVESDDAKQLTTVTLAQAIQPGSHTLTLAYTGKLETAPQGLFVQQYRNGTSRGEMFSTQFEATDARRMFPCWDEPAFRATFQLSATLPAEWSTVSNMPVESRSVNGASATTTFRRTPKMPTYLLEFSAGDLAHIDADANGTHFGIWAVRGQERLGDNALANAQQILADYNEYFGYPYPLPKLDSIAVPGGFSGAMENWGAITYNDQALLVGPAATLEARQRVFSIQAHEMAHQWNGDLVTMSWWDDIWLNESFASWMETKETAARNPSWRWFERDDKAREDALNADARINSHPLEQHVTNEMEAAASFDGAITYNKGKNVLRMLEAYLGEGTFRDGIRRYIKARAYSNATSGDLWSALSAAAGRDVEKIAAGWTTQAGYPLLTVRARCNALGERSIAVSQRRFLLAGDDPAAPRWSIPLHLRFGSSTPVYRLLSEPSATFAGGSCRSPLTVNAGGVGFFRVAYDDRTLRTNTRAFAGLPDADKIALLDDQWALVESGRASLGSYLGLAPALRTSLDARAWEQVLGTFSLIERDARGSAVHDRFTAYARSLLRPVFRKIGWDPRAGEDATSEALRRDVIAHLGAWNEPEVVREARRRFSDFVVNRTALDAPQQEIVLTIVAQHADQATFDRLHAIAKGSENEEQGRRYYGALGAVRDPKLIRQALEILVSSELPPQMVGLRARLITLMAPNDPPLVWQFYRAHVEELNASTSELSRALSIARVPSTFWNAAPLSELEAFVKAKGQPAPEMYVARAMEQARFDLALKARLVPAAGAYVASLPKS